MRSRGGNRQTAIYNRDSALKVKPLRCKRLFHQGFLHSPAPRFAAAACSHGGNMAALAAIGAVGAGIGVGIAAAVGAFEGGSDVNVGHAS